MFESSEICEEVSEWSELIELIVSPPPVSFVGLREVSWLTFLLSLWRLCGRLGVTVALSFDPLPLLVVASVGPFFLRI